jgi:glycosyltransferase involved in cell wall biosynthesis
MRVCILGDASSVHVARWVSFFAKEGHDVSVITLRDETESRIRDIGNIQVHYMGSMTIAGRSRSRLSAFLNAGRVKAVLKQVRPQVLHAHEFVIYGSLAAFMDYHPLMISAWGSDVLFPDGEPRVRKALIRRAVRKAELLHCEGPKAREAMIRMGADPSKIAVIPFGVDTEKYSSAKKSTRLGTALGWGDAFIIFNLRGLRYPLYGGETLVKAIPMVVKEIPSAKFVLGGEGRLAQEFREMAKEAGVLEHLSMPGAIPDDELPEYYASADLYVSVSLSDSGLAASTAEAMSSGVPVIVTDDVDNREWVKDRENGFLIPPRDHQLLAKRIIELAKDRQMGLDMGRRNREIILEKDNRDIVLREVAALYERLAYEKGGLNR